MRPALIAPLALALCLAALPAQPNFNKVMVSEVSWGEPDCVELTNHSHVTVVAINWTVRVRIQGAGDFVSDPFVAILAPGRQLVVFETSPAPPPPLPSDVLTTIGFTVDLPLGAGAFCVALYNEFGFPVDEVNVTNGTGAPGVAPFGGFLGHAVRSASGSTLSSGCVERIWGLDSDRGSDWTEQAAPSLGLENRNSGARGTDPAPLADIKLNEISAGASSFIELQRSGPAIDLDGWFLVFSEAQDAPRSFKYPFGPGSMIGGASPFAVIGDTPNPPAECPPATLYANVGIFGPLGLSASEFSVGLYDASGRCIDLVRATATDSELVHNEPRLPAARDRFTGAVRRSSLGAGVVGRTGSGQSGMDWHALATRTMGAANGASVGPAGHADPVDLRLNDGPLQSGAVAFILDGPDSWQGNLYAIAPSLFHSSGTGPLLGLGSDALSNFLLLLGLPPFTGALDAAGSARFDFGAFTLPFGTDIDLIAVVFTPAGAFVGRTLCLAYDA